MRRAATRRPPTRYEVIEPDLPPTPRCSHRLPGDLTDREAGRRRSIVVVREDQGSTPVLTQVLTGAGISANGVAG